MNVTTTLCGSAPQSSRPGVHGFQIKQHAIHAFCIAAHLFMPCDLIYLTCVLHLNDA